jgi:hypothetical protein
MLRQVSCGPRAPTNLARLRKILVRPGKLPLTGLGIRYAIFGAKVAVFLTFNVPRLAAVLLKQIQIAGSHR